jgi:Fe-S-cluster-containing dehydrogenase component/CRP-like cAMP-binding protein
MAADLYFDELAQRWEEEGLFARDEAGQLIRYERKTQQDYDRAVTLTIDGVPITVRKAVPAKDAQGNVIYVDASGRTVPRATTIYDAAMQLLARQNADARNAGELPRPAPIPTLCHLEHLSPVGVCRVCAVAVGKMSRDRKDPGVRRLTFPDKLVPACVHPVEDGMEVITLGYRSLPSQPADVVKQCSAQRTKVASNVRVLLELLAADHLHSAVASGSRGVLTDLERLIIRYGQQLGLDPSRFALRPPPARPRDDSSPLIAVDHSACILCDRCARACSDVKQNFVIARSGKGYTTQIAFDLADPMGNSSCVECGECMLSCPTNALTFRRSIESDWFLEQVGQGPRGGVYGKSAVSPEEMEDNELLRTLPWRYRQWNQSSIVRWRVQAGQELCQLGDYGSTAFILNRGRFGVWIPKRGTDGELLTGWDQGEPADVNDPRDLILGEMTILSLYPRTATVRALEDGEVYEIRRNVLYTLQRNPESRQKLDRVYRSRAINNHLRQVALFADLCQADRDLCLEILQREPEVDASGHRPVELFRIEPGQTIFRQGERADCFYMIRIGHVKVSQTFGGIERVLDYLRPNRSFGEIACLGCWDEVRLAMPADLRGALDGRRTTSCAALDDVELVRIDAGVFRELLATVPVLRDKVVQQAQDYLARQSQAAEAAPERVNSSLLAEFTEQGLYNAQRLLVLDLDACTRCDECTKACSDTHDGITRLIREGLRLGKWLVASSCRSCSDPYCLVGCPVDAIHRIDPSSSRNPIKLKAASGDADRQRVEIQIENNCIGCGLCASNCPYGNINMHPSETKDRTTGLAVLQYHATTCDLCADIVGNDWRNVSCVHACPHEAAHRVKGTELLEIVARGRR